MLDVAVLEAGKAAMLVFRLQELSRCVKSGLHHQSFVTDNRWWLLSRPDGLSSKLSQALLLTEQLGYMRNEENLPKSKLPILLKKKFGGCFRIRDFHNRFWVCVSGVDDNLAPCQEKIVFKKKTGSQNQRWSELKKDTIASALRMQMKRKAEPSPNTQ
jgi:hypothetical protein